MNAVKTHTQTYVITNRFDSINCYKQIHVTTLVRPSSCLILSFSNTDRAQVKGGIPALKKNILKAQKLK